MPVNKLTVFSGTITSTGAQTPVNTNGVTGDYTVKLLISAQYKAFVYGSLPMRIGLEDSTNSFSSVGTLCTLNVDAMSLPLEGLSWSFRKRDFGGLDVAGEVGAAMRLNVEVLLGMSPSVTIDAWIEF